MSSLAQTFAVGFHDTIPFFLNSTGYLDTNSKSIYIIQTGCLPYGKALYISEQFFADNEN